MYSSLQKIKIKTSAKSANYWISPLCRKKLLNLYKIITLRLCQNNKYMFHKITSPCKGAPSTKSEDIKHLHCVVRNCWTCYKIIILCRCNHHNVRNSDQFQIKLPGTSLCSTDCKKHHYSEYIFLVIVNRLFDETMEMDDANQKFITIRNACQCHATLNIWYLYMSIWSFNLYRGGSVVALVNVSTIFIKPVKAGHSYIH